MGFGQAIGSGFRNYVGFSGRATRSEFWWWQLFVFLVAVVLTFIDQLGGLHLTGATDWNINTGGSTFVVTNPGMPLLASIWYLVVLLPSIAMTMRRFHDAGHSGWWWLWTILLNFLCCAGFVIWIVFALQKSQPDNKYGPAPAN